MFYLKKAKAAGIPIIVIDPRKNDTAVALNAQWIPIRPATDSALADAMAYVIIKEGLQDQEFLDKCCLGFDAAICRKAQIHPLTAFLFNGRNRQYSKDT